jgi:glycosyltransferase involved in cell wall biosynthesis
MEPAVKVSVIVPTHNRADYLPDALDSIFAQGLDDIEVIVVDDHSTDHTATVLKRYDSRIHTLRRTVFSNSPARVLNDGLQVARGQYVAFLDSDDIWLPDKLARQLPLVEGDPGCGVAYGNLVFLEDGVKSPPAAPGETLPSGWILASLVEDMFVHPSTLIVRRAILDRAGWFDEDTGSAEHYDLQLRLARLTRAAVVHTPVAIVRRHGGQHSRLHRGDNYRSAIAVLRRIADDHSLPRAIRRTARRTSARHHTTLARLLWTEGQRAVARQHIRAALFQHPFSRAAWYTGVRTLSLRAHG